MLLEEVIVESCVHALVKAYSESVPIVLVDQSEVLEGEGIYNYRGLWWKPQCENIVQKMLCV